MKLLFNQNISYRIVKKLVEFFPESKHISDCGLMNCTDSEIWEFAKKNEFVIVSFDSDFYDISVINGFPPKVIWIRIGNTTTQNITDLLIHNHETIQKFSEDENFKNLSCLELI